VPTYAPSFFRQQLHMPTGLVSIFMAAAALCYICGLLTGGRLVKTIGRKPLTVSGALGAGIFTILYANLLDLWTSVGVVLLACLFAGIRLSASTTLTLEQVPAFRGTMMSARHATLALAEVLGSGIGGLALLQFGYGSMAAILGSMGIAAAIIFHLLAVDPAKSDIRKSSCGQP